MLNRFNRVSGTVVASVLVTGAVCATVNSAQADKTTKSVKQLKTQPIKIAQAEMPMIESLRVTRGGQITLPLTSITKILPDDEEVARGRFLDGKAIIEGVTTGVTTVRVEQLVPGSQVATVHRYEVEVLDGNAVTTPAAIPVSVAPPVTVVTPVGAAKPIVAATSTTTTTKTSSTVTVPAPAVAKAAAPAITPDPVISTVSLPAAKSLTISLGVEPAEDNPSQALFTITYGNPTATDAKNTVLRYALDDVVSYVTASATNGARYDAAARELIWNLGTLPAGTVGKKVQFRIAAVDPSVEKFYSAATIESEGAPAVASNQLEYPFNPTPLLTVFALPDRILQGKNNPALVDVRGLEYQDAIDRMQKMGVVQGVGAASFEPARTTERAEYTVMILRGLNLKDLRDISAIKFVLSRKATVNLTIRDSSGKEVQKLVRNGQFDAGERTVIWDGKTSTGYAPAGLYTYICTARDPKGITTTLRGNIRVIPQVPLDASGTSSFTDVRPNTWYSPYIAQAEKEDIVNGYPNNEFRPAKPINRVEATAIVVRAIGLEDLAKRAKGKEAGFLDDHMIPDWATGYVYVASTIAKTNTGKLIVGYPSNMFLPLNPMRRDAAALVVQRMVDKETNRKIYVSGQLIPGTSVTINSQKVVANDDGSFSFTLEQNTADPTSVAVIDRRR